MPMVLCGVNRPSHGDQANPSVGDASAGDSCSRCCEQRRRLGVAMMPADDCGVEVLGVVRAWSADCGNCK